MKNLNGLTNPVRSNGHAKAVKNPGGLTDPLFDEIAWPHEGGEESRHEAGDLNVCFNQAMRQSKDCCLCSVSYTKLVNSCADMAFYGFSRNEE